MIFANAAPAGYEPFQYPHPLRAVVVGEGIRHRLLPVTPAFGLQYTSAFPSSNPDSAAYSRRLQAYVPTPEPTPGKATYREWLDALQTGSEIIQRYQISHDYAIA